MAKLSIQYAILAIDHYYYYMNLHESCLTVNLA